MLLCFMYRVGNEPRPELCLIADKPDQFSVAVNVDSLVATDSAVIRLGTFEAVTVRRESEVDGDIIAPVIPSKMYLTPSQPDRPGIIVSRIRVVKAGDGHYSVFFQNDKEIETGEWLTWKPNERRT